MENDIKVRSVGELIEVLKTFPLDREVEYCPGSRQHVIYIDNGIQPICPSDTRKPLK